MFCEDILQNQDIHLDIVKANLVTIHSCIIGIVSLL